MSLHATSHMYGLAMLHYIHVAGLVFSSMVLALLTNIVRNVYLYHLVQPK
jgi:hypothetical protein